MRAWMVVASSLLASSSPGAAGDLAATYREPAARILGAALTDEAGWAKLEHLTTVIGHRLSGSPQLEEAVEWVYGQMLAEGLENVRLQPVAVPHWVRGAESAEVLAPAFRRLSILGLGGSVGTPPAGIEAPAVVVDGFDALERLGRAGVEGKIVVYATRWQGTTPFEGYLSTVQYRSRGASRAAALGAVAALVRSATERSLATPHTGALRYDEGAPKIPAAAITVEDAEWLSRRAARGDELRIRLTMGARLLGAADSANVIAEIAGRERPGEVVVMGGHLDSWDVGEGAHDDGAGCVAAWQALHLLHELGLRPRRTLRVVLWTNEENGLAGAEAYAAGLGAAVGDHVAAIEMDGGVERPVGLGLGLAGVEPDSGDPVYEAAFTALADAASLLAPIEAGAIGRGGGGADIGPLMRAGVPGLALQTTGEHYFDWHHTAADTLDKVEPLNLRRATAALALMGYVLADMPERLVPAGWKPPAPPEASTPRGEPWARFAGVLPCADCAGIRTELALWVEPPGELATRYLLRETYLDTGDGDRTFESEGEWVVLRGSATDPDATVYELDPGRPDRTRRFLRRGDYELELLDRERREIASDLDYGLGRLEGLSLAGDWLIVRPPSAEFRAQQEALLQEARARLAADSGDAEAAIWVGRRLAYLGLYGRAIETFSTGHARHPGDARFLRHRGHRWITVRDFPRAIADLEAAAAVVEGRPDEVEPDGLPNERGIPTSTLQSNIRYHLGLARYLSGDFEGALAAYREDVAAAANPDTLVAASYWLYLTLRRLGEETEAAAVLAPIAADLDVVENGDYHRLLLAYKGELDPDALLAEAATDPAAVAYPTVAYGVGAWHLVEGRTERARELFRQVLASPTWAAFGFIAAEAELARWGGGARGPRPGCSGRRR